MSTVFLRELLESGFCGKHRTVTKGTGLGKVHTALDRIIAAGALSTLGEEGARVQLGNQFQIPYAHKPHFDQCLQGIFERREELQGTSDRSVQEFTSPARKAGWKIVHTSIYEKSTDTWVEPVYSFYVPQHNIPFYALLTAALCDNDLKDIKVKMVSVCSENSFNNTSQYHILDELRQMLVDALDEEKIKAGQGCTSCPLTDCKFKGEFENLMLAWLKSQQAEEALKEKVRQHLIWHGPTKVGAHLVYMREHARRSLAPKNFSAFYQQIVEAAGPTHSTYLSANVSAVFKAAEEGKLPKGILELFKRSNYYSVETGLSL